MECTLQCLHGNRVSAERTGIEVYVVVLLNKNFSIRTRRIALIACAVALATFARMPSARASSDDMNDNSRSLAYLSVQAPIPDPQESAATVDSPNQAPKAKGGMFSDSQATLMRDLSKTIDVIPGGVRLCLNIHY
jgi:hypothetical protein